jgi:hypothetical protein
MIIPPNENGWSYHDLNAWKLVYDGITIIFFDETDQVISTQSTLFVGTEQECKNHIDSLNLKRPDQQ